MERDGEDQKERENLGLVVLIGKADKKKLSLNFFDSMFYIVFSTQLLMQVSLKFYDILGLCFKLSKF